MSASLPTARDFTLTAGRDRSLVEVAREVNNIRLAKRTTFLSDTEEARHSKCLHRNNRGFTHRQVNRT